MSAITLRGPGPNERGRKDVADHSLPALLEFHSPTNALAVTPVMHGARSVTWMVATLVAACFAAASLIPVDKVVTGQGRIVAQQATSVIQPLETAIVRSIDVREGDTVKRGDILARLDPTFASADLGALQSQVASLRTEVERLQAEASGLDYKPGDASPIAVLQGAIFIQRKAERAYKNENYTQKINSLESQVKRAVSDVYAYSERLKVASEVEQKRMELERLQVGSQLNRLAATDSRLEVKRGLDNAGAQAAQANRDLQALQAERDAYNQTWRAQVSQDLTDQSRKLSDAEENLKKAALRRQLVELRADRDSVVLNVAKVSPGSVMQSGEQLITLVPVDAPLEAEVNIAGSDAGFVHAGNPVNIKLDTLPYTQYGTVGGAVRVVSPDSFTSNPDDQKRGAQQPQAQGPAYYRSRLTLDDIKLHDTPAGFRLMPGMPVTADVKVGQRTMVSYLLARVLPTFMDGMREP
ncbi:MAG: HlyD family type I secretion periplasmic adaptor subunit [Acetobacteraceae bacterium]